MEVERLTVIVLVCFIRDDETKIKSPNCTKPSVFLLALFAI